MHEGGTSNFCTTGGERGGGSIQSWGLLQQFAGPCWEHNDLCARGERAGQLHGKLTA